MDKSPKPIDKVTNDSDQPPSYMYPPENNNDKPKTFQNTTLKIHNTHSAHTISTSNTQLYHLTHHNTQTHPDLVLHKGDTSSGPQLAIANLTTKPPSKDIQFHLGGQRNPTGDDWDLARHSTSSSGHRFTSSTTTAWRFDVREPTSPTSNTVKRLQWRETKKKGLLSKLPTARDYELVDEADDVVVATYEEKHLERPGTLKGVVEIRGRSLSERELLAALVVVMALQEKFRRKVALLGKGGGGGGAGVGMAAG